MTGVTRSGPCMQTFSELWFPMSHVSPLIWDVWFPPDPDLILILHAPSLEWFSSVFLTLNHTPIPSIMNWHYFHDPPALQHFPFHRGSLSVACKAYDILHYADWTEQHRVIHSMKTFPTQILLRCLSATHCADVKEWPPQLIRRQWLKWDDPIPGGKYTGLSEVLVQMPNIGQEWIYQILLTYALSWTGRDTNMEKVLYQVENEGESQEPLSITFTLSPSNI